VHHTGARQSDSAGGGAAARAKLCGRSRLRSAASSWRSRASACRPRCEPSAEVQAGLGRQAQPAAGNRGPVAPAASRSSAQTRTDQRRRGECPPPMLKGARLVQFVSTRRPCVTHSGGNARWRRPLQERAEAAAGRRCAGRSDRHCGGGLPRGVEARAAHGSRVQCCVFLGHDVSRGPHDARCSE